MPKNRKITPFAGVLSLEDRDGIAALASDGTGLGTPAARGVGELFQRLGQIVLADGVIADQRLGMLAGWGGAVGADEGLGGRIPGGFSAAGRAVELALCLTFGGREGRRHRYLWRDGIGSHWASWVRGSGCEGLFRMGGQPTTDGCCLGMAGFESQHRFVVAPGLGRIVQFSGVQAGGGQMERRLGGLGGEEQFDLFDGVLGMAGLLQRHGEIAARFGVGGAEEQGLFTGHKSEIQIPLIQRDEGEVVIGLVEGRIDLGGSAILGRCGDQIPALMGADALLEVRFGRSAIARRQQTHCASDVAGRGGAPGRGNFRSGCRSRGSRCGGCRRSRWAHGGGR